LLLIEVTASCSTTLRILLSIVFLITIVNFLSYVFLRITSATTVSLRICIVNQWGSFLTTCLSF
jgi:hypothetical protein